MGQTVQLLRCPYKEACCFKKKENGHLYCKILSDTRFYDGKCHFRKRKVDGENLYDKWRKENEEVDE